MYKKFIILILLLLCLSLPIYLYANGNGPLRPDQGQGFPQLHGQYTIGLVENVTTYLIYIVAVGGVFGVIFSGILYLVSAGDDEKAKKAKNWIIYSLVGVFISVSAWGIVALLNNMQIGF